jgi:hypothetical protein
MPRMNIFNAVEQEAFESAAVFNSFQRKLYFDFPKLSSSPPRTCVRPPISFAFF